MMQQNSASTSIRDRFLADHKRLEDLLTRLLAAVEANDREDLQTCWNEFESGLLAHLDAEEKHMIPALPRAREQDARRLLQEHRHIRGRLTELSMAVDVHLVRLDRIREFIDALRAHARDEDRLLYEWTDTHLGVAERMTAMGALAKVVQKLRSSAPRSPN